MIGNLSEFLRRVQSSIVRGLVESVMDEDLRDRIVKVITGVDEDGNLITREHIEHVEPVGLTSVPNADADVIILCPNCDTEHGVAIVADGRHRPKDLTAGQTAIYESESDVDDNHLVILRDSGIELGKDASTKAKAAREGDTVRVTIPTDTQVVDPNTGRTLAAFDIDGTITSGSSEVDIAD